MGNKTFDFSSKKKGFFAQKRPNLAQNWHFWSIWARPCKLIQCPIGGLVGGCGARAVSCKTPIYFIIIFLFLQFCCVAGYHNLIILRGDRAIYPEKGLLATNYQGKTIFLLTLQQRDRSRDKILISKYCISYLSAYCAEMYRGRAACYWLDI